MNLVRGALEFLPPELKWRGNMPRHPSSNFGTDVQTANLCITQLHIRYNLLEQVIKILRKSNTIRVTTPEVISERHSIINDMLEILKTMPHEILMANGYSLVNKIRDIGSALLEDVNPKTGQEPSNNLSMLLELLNKLDSPAEAWKRPSTAGSR